MQALRPAAPRLHTQDPSRRMAGLEQHAGMPADEEVPGRALPISARAGGSRRGVAIGPTGRCAQHEAGLLGGTARFSSPTALVITARPCPPEPGSPHDILVNWLHSLVGAAQPGRCARRRPVSSCRQLQQN